MHDNNFHNEGSAPFWMIYKGKPPYNVEKDTEAALWTDEEAEQMMQMYEDAVAYAAENRDTITAINAFDFLALVG